MYQCSYLVHCCSVCISLSLSSILIIHSSPSSRDHQGNELLIRVCPPLGPLAPSVCLYVRLSITVSFCPFLCPPVCLLACFTAKGTGNFLSYIRCPFDRIGTSVRQGDNNKHTHTVAAGYFWTTVFLDVLQLLFVYCARSSFALDLLAGYTVSGCYEITMFT